MVKYTPYQTRYLAEQIVLRRAKDSYDNMASAISGVKVDLNPHQVDAALFAMKSPLSTGALLADEVGLGKTVEAGLVLAQYWAERKRRILIIVPASLRTQWRTELSEKFYIDSILLDSTIYNKAKKLVSLTLLRLIIRSLFAHIILLLAKTLKSGQYLGIWLLWTRHTGYAMFINPAM